MSALPDDLFQKLVPRLLQGDTDAENQFFELAHGYLMAVSHKFLHVTDADREDYVLEVIEKALSKLDRYSPGKGKFKTWLYVMATNFARDKGRHLRDGRDVLHNAVSEEALEWTHAELPTQSPPDEDEPAQIDDRTTALGLALGRLDPVHQQIVWAISHGRSARDLAEELGLSHDNVRKIYQRTRERLRAELDDDFNEPED
jgi:RNA polymerase sigma factor (sigma-70 family)